MLAAQAEAERAGDDEKRFSGEAGLARERILFLLGWNGAALPAEFAAVVAPPTLPASPAELEKLALASRPDLRACEIAVEAAAKRAGLAKDEIFTLTAVMDANGSGKQGFEMGPGAQLAIPIFNRNQGGRARAAAEVERAAWSCIGMQQRIRLEVREAYTKAGLSAEALQNWNGQLLPRLEELVRRSEKACELGEMTPLAVQENARQLLAARVRAAELAAEQRRARAELERGIGASLRTGGT